VSENLIHTVFDVPDVRSAGNIGYLGLVRSPRGLRRVSHVHATPEGALAELASRFPHTERDDAAFGDLPQRLRRFYGGELVSFDDALDWEGITPFHRRIYEAALRIPWGQARSYGQLATEAGRPLAARAVGQAMGRNPWPIVVP